MKKQCIRFVEWLRDTGGRSAGPRGRVTILARNIMLLLFRRRLEEPFSNLSKNTARKSTHRSNRRAVRRMNYTLKRKMARL